MHFSTDEEILKELRKKKIESIEIANLYKTNGDKKSFLNILMCATQVDIAKLNNKEVKISRLITCKNRFCPQCAKRRSIKIFAKIAQKIEKVEKEKKMALCTLTIENVPDVLLNDAINQISKGINQFIKKIKPQINGYFRTIEITYNKKAKTYHPHVHILLDLKDYILQKEISEKWKKSIKKDYTPICDIRLIRADEEGSLAGAVAEVAKYATKFSIFKNKSNLSEKEKMKILSDLSTALCSRRLISSSGTLKIKLNDDLTDDVIVNEIEKITSYEWRKEIEEYIKVNYDLKD